VNMETTPARQDLFLQSPWMNAAGMLGFVPPRDWNWPYPPGAFVTNPISLAPRTPAGERGQMTYPGGVLLHSGLPNPGLRAVLHRWAVQWQRSPVPVWLHLIPSGPEEAARMVRVIEDSQVEVFALELGIPPGASLDETLAILKAAVGDLPLVVNLSLTAAGEGWIKKLAGAGAAAFSLSTPRGALLQANGKVFNGRLYGPGLLPLMLAAVRTAASSGLPVIAGGGVYRLADGEALLAAGAVGVMLDTVLWGWPAT
jgi:dihydroorotate dehydrogenase (NAD+) catalytic subunit